MTVNMEALLVGHEDWVFSAAWQPQHGADAEQPCLLSASMDRTMMLWRPEASSGGLKLISIPKHGRHGLCSHSAKALLACSLLPPYD